MAVKLNDASPAKMGVSLIPQAERLAMVTASVLVFMAVSSSSIIFLENTTSPSLSMLEVSF